MSKAKKTGTADVINLNAKKQRDKSAANNNETPKVEIDDTDDQAPPNAPPHVPPPVDDPIVVLDPSNPMHSARELVRTKFTTLDGLRKLHRHRGAFWQWTGSYYRPADEETIRSQFWTFLEKSFRREKKKDEENWNNVPFKPNRARVTAISTPSDLVLPNPDKPSVMAWPLPSNIDWSAVTPIFRSPGDEWWKTQQAEGARARIEDAKRADALQAEEGRVRNDPKLWRRG
jgi:hypothetical protein